MTTNEWKQVSARMIANWPAAAKVPDISLAKWYEDLQDFPVEQVIVAVESLYREGKEFCPNGGQIRKRILELSDDAPQWAEVWNAVLAVVSRYPYEQQAEANEDLTNLHPVAGYLASLMDWRWFRFSDDDLTTKEAQLRGKWNGLVRRAQRDWELQGLPSAGLRALERSNGGLRKLGLKAIGGTDGSEDASAKEGERSKDAESKGQAQPEVGNTLETSSR